METITDERTSLQIRRVIEAPVAVVYAAFTDPEKMKYWMGPSDAFGEAQVSIDLRVGGRYRIVMTSPDGEVHRVGGTYKEIVAGKKLVYTWAWESTPERESLVTVELTPAGSATELLLTHQRFADTETRDKHQHGWIGCLDRLGRFLAR
jgi:uncharacterized protein YndB with AHSA1/START domain